MADQNLLTSLPAEAKLWIYPVSRKLTEADQAQVTVKMDVFFAQWQSHGRPVAGEMTIINNRFIVIGAKLNSHAGDISGCGVDACLHALQKVVAELDMVIEPLISVFYDDAEGQAQAVSRPDFRGMVKNGKITAETIVYDTTLTSVQAFRKSGIRRPAGQTWHAKIFRLPALTN